jgi:hypothetical protein
MWKMQCQESGVLQVLTGLRLDLDLLRRRWIVEKKIKCLSGWQGITISSSFLKSRKKEINRRLFLGAEERKTSGNNELHQFVDERDLSKSGITRTLGEQDSSARRRVCFVMDNEDADWDNECCTQSKDLGYTDPHVDSKISIATVDLSIGEWQRLLGEDISSSWPEAEGLSQETVAVTNKWAALATKDGSESK